MVGTQIWNSYGRTLDWISKQKMKTRIFLTIAWLIYFFMCDSTLKV